MRPHRAVVIEPGLPQPGLIRRDRPRVAVWSRTGPEAGSWTLGSAPGVWVSSGLGDDRVGPRLGLFERVVGNSALDPEAQDAFHRHRWGDRPEISVLMERAEARTVSITTVEVAGDRVRMGYEEVAETGEVGRPETTEALVRSG